MTTWSLHEEICTLAQEKEFHLALFKLGILGDSQENYSVREDSSWSTGGAETFIFRFWITRSDGIEKGFIVKACVVFAPGNSLQAITEEWVSRRELLSKNGIGTPKLVAFGNGTIIEEFIPYDYLTRLRTATSMKLGPQRKMLLQLANYAGVLSSLGFDPLSPFSDLRSRGDDLIPVDFGEDLGPVQKKLTYDQDKIFNMMLKKLDQWKISLDIGFTFDLHHIYVNNSSLRLMKG